MAENADERLLPPPQRLAFACAAPGCTFAAHSRPRLEKHMLQPHGPPAAHVCMVQGCSYTSCTKQELRRHERSHANAPQFPCGASGCGLALKRHVGFVHRRERPFACSMPGCAYAAANRTSLRQHMFTHTGGGRFACTVAGCSYSAASRARLEQHMRGHEGERGRGETGGGAGCEEV